MNDIYLYYLPDILPAILKNLKTSIKEFIIPLYNDGYVLGNCDKDHMLINNKNEIHFYYSSITHVGEKDENKDILGLCEFIKYLYNNTQIPSNLNEIINSVISVKGKNIDGKNKLNELVNILENLTK
jgi:hypothetical protein